MSDKALSLIACALASAVAVWHGLRLGPWMLDDTFIFCRYAEHWAAGHGLSWNVGEAPVEGMTSFTWTAVLALGALLGLDVVEVARCGGYACVLATLLLVSQAWRILRLVDARAAAVATLLLGTSGAFAPWAQAGMDAALNALVFTLLALLAMRARERELPPVQHVAIGLLCALVPMSRPEALLIVLWLAFDVARAGRLRGVAIAAGTFALAYGAFFLWRWSYFGHLLPNTAYAKVGGTVAEVVRGLRYLGDSALAVLPVAALAVLGRLNGAVDARYRGLFGVVLVQAVIVVLVGGDVMPGYRFVAPVMPVLCLLAGLALRDVTPRLRAAATVPACAFGIAWLVLVVEPVVRDDVVAHNGRIAGEWLRAHAPAGAVVATNTAGTVPYYSRLRTIDMLGLNDVHIAHREMPGMGSGHAGHEKGDGAYVFARRPEFIQLGSSLGWAPTRFAPDPPFPGDRELWAMPEFHAEYKLLHRTGPTVWPGGSACGVFGFWVRKDVWARLEGQ